jgi:hypothetical protein
VHCQLAGFVPLLQATFLKRFSRPPLSLDKD